MAELICMRLNSGEEIIAQIEHEFPDKFLLTKARQLQIIDIGGGKAGAAFVPVLLLAHDSHPITVLKSSIGPYTEHLNAEYEQRYLESISGISLATSING